MQAMDKRRVEVLRDEEWVAIPFEELRIGDTFRLWQLVIEADATLNADVVAWRCESSPLQTDGTYGVQCKPAITVPIPVSEPIESAGDQTG